MKKLLLTFQLSESSLAQIEALGFEIDYHSEKEDLSELKSDADALVSFQAVSRMSPENFSNLEFIQLSSTGIDQVPLSFDEAGIPVSNFKGGYSRSIGEFTVARLLEVYKGLRLMHQDQADSKWKVRQDLLDLYQKKVLILGTGSISLEIATKLQCFGVELFGASKSGRLKEPFKEVYTTQEITKVLPAMDVVIGTLPKTPETDDFFDDTFFSQMKEGSVFVNVARGNAVDEEALLGHASKFKAIVLDVFKHEPLPEDDPLRQLENIYISSHNSWISETVIARREELIVENLRRFIQGEELLNRVDLKKGY